MTAAAITGSFADFKIIRTRGVCQIVVEVPLEQADAALAALGGVPQPATERPVAIARLTPEAAERKPRTTDDAVDQSNREYSSQLARERYVQSDEGSQAVTRAAVLADDPYFQKWAGADKNKRDHPSVHSANYIRAMCKIDSRSKLATDPAALQRFLALETAFKYRDTPYAGGKP